MIFSHGHWLSPFTRATHSWHGENKWNKYENHLLAFALVDFVLVMRIILKSQNIFRARNIFEKVCDIIFAVTIMEELISNIAKPNRWSSAMLIDFHLSLVLRTREVVKINEQVWKPFAGFCSSWFHLVICITFKIM